MLDGGAVLEKLHFSQGFGVGILSETLGMGGKGTKSVTVRTDMAHHHVDIAASFFPYVSLYSY